MKDKYPKAWADFEKWYNTAFSTNNILQLPFEMQLGVYMKFFAEKGYRFGVAIIEEARERVGAQFDFMENQLTKQK